MDLSKAYVCLPHDLLIVKLAAYGFDNTALALITNYLTNRIQRVKIGSTFCPYLEVLRGIPQGSMLGPILSDLVINDLMFLFKETQVCSSADDTTIYSCSLNYEEPHPKLSNDTHIVLNWFRTISMVAYPSKFQIMFLVSSINNNNIPLIAENKHIIGTK